MDGEDTRDLIELYSPSRPQVDRDQLAQFAMSLAEDGTLARRWSRVHEADNQIGAALRNVAIPPNLRGTILAEMQTVPSTLPIRTHRRQLIGAAAGSLMAASLLLAFGWILWGRHTPPITIFCEKAVEVYRQSQELPLEPLDPKALADFPTHFRRDLCQGTRLVNFLGHRVRAFQFASAEGSLLVLVIPRKWFPSDVDLPLTMSRSLVGMTVACSPDERGRNVYVAMIDGEEHDLLPFRVRLPIT